MRIIIFLLALVIASPAVHADVTADDLNAAGIKAAKAKDWELARSKFAESYARDPRSRTLFNLATAQEQTGKLVAAHAGYRLFIERSTAPGEESLRGIAKTKLAALAAKLGSLAISRKVPPDAVTELDGRKLDEAELAAPIVVDPGKHTLIVRRGTEVLLERSVSVDAGAEVAVTLAPTVTVPPPEQVRLPPPTVAPPVRVVPPLVVKPERPAGPEDKSILRSPWFWGITSVVVLGAAAGGYYMFSSEDPMRGSLGPGVLTVP